MKNFKNKLIALVYALILSCVFLPVNSAKALDPNCDFYKQFEIDKTSNAVDGLPQYCTASQLGSTIITVILSLAGSALVLFVIVGGFLLITAGGNEEQSEKGKKVMTNAVLGMVVVVMAFAIVKIVTNTLTGNLGSGTTNNGGGGPTPTPGTSGTPTPTGGGASVDAAKAHLRSGINIPNSVASGGTLQITADYNRAAYADDIKNVCGGITIIGDNVSMVALNSSGQVLGSSKLSGGPTKLFATISIPADSLPSDGDILVRICDVAISTGSVSVRP